MINAVLVRMKSILWITISDVIKLAILIGQKGYLITLQKAIIILLTSAFNGSFFKTVKQ